MISTGQRSADAPTTPGVSPRSPVNKPRVQVLDEMGAGLAQRDGPGAGVAVGVAGIGEHVAERDALAGHRGQHADERADRVMLA